jgi:hypothetical protein
LTTRRTFALTTAVLLVALARCGTSFAPASEVHGLRLLGMRAEPAEPRPGEAVTLEALVVDPTRDAGNAILWFGCPPSASPNANACSNQDVLQALTTEQPDAGGIPEGLQFLGTGPQVRALVPYAVFAGVDAGDPVRVTGVLAQVVAIAVAAPEPTSLDAGFALLGQVRRNEVPNVAALFRYPVSENPTPNRNPVLRAFELDGQPVPPGATVRLASPDAGLDLDVDPSSFEPYVEVTPTGPIDRTETLAASYFSSIGKLSELATLVNGPVTEAIRTGDAGPGSSGMLWSVVRDTRGGQSWLAAPLFVCDPAAPAPSARSAELDGGIVLTGNALGSVLDLQVGPAIAPALSCSDSSCTAGLPALDAGVYPITLRTRSCVDVDTRLTLTRP